MKPYHTVSLMMFIEQQTEVQRHIRGTPMRQLFLHLPVVASPLAAVVPGWFKDSTSNWDAAETVIEDDTTPSINLHIFGCTLWLFNIAMENGPFYRCFSH